MHLWDRVGGRASHKVIVDKEREGASLLCAHLTKR